MIVARLIVAAAFLATAAVQLAEADKAIGKPLSTKLGGASPRPEARTIPFFAGYDPLALADIAHP